MTRVLISLTVLALLGPAISGAAEPTRLLRMPDIHLDQVVFVYAGDLYVGAADGGVASRLTSHEGLELFPKYSPDGQQIAFSAEYNGTRQVYVMPVSGGQPRQLTWYNDVGAMPPRGGFDYRVLDWSADGKHVLVRANRLPWGPRMGQFYLVPVEGGDEKPLAIPEGGGGMFSPDGRQVVYTPIDREFRTWKRHRGGRAQDVWTYDLTSNVSQRLTDDVSTDNQPVWVGDDIYFTSDREFILNLFRWKRGEKPEQVTRHDNFDVLWPSAGPQAIVYENGGWIYRFDPASGQSTRVALEVAGDRPGRMPRVVEASEFIQAADVSPDGKRAAFSARGELFTVPAENGPVRNISSTPQAREIDGTWSPDGSQIAYLSDATGEYEIWVVDQKGEGSARQITTNGKIWRFAPQWSPDGTKLLYGDKSQALNYVDVATGKVTVIDRSTHEDFTSYTWAPDSHHVAYVKDNAVGFSSIWIRSLSDAASVQVTGDNTNDTSPAFDPEGRYLYFLSSRDYDLAFGSLEFNYLVTNSVRVYAALLHEDGPALFLPASDESGVDDTSDTEDKNDGKKPGRLAIDLAGINGRVVALQDEGGVYRQLSATAAGPLYLHGQGDETALRLFDLKAQSEKEVMRGINNYQLSASGKHLLFRQGSHWGIAPAEPDQSSGDGRLNLDNMELVVDPGTEWRQMYVDGWRILRDWFYDPHMHGMDWPAIRDKYAGLVEHVAHRADLDYIFGEIAGEMNAGHIYVQTGDQPAVQRRPGGLLGAEFEAAEGYYRITHIYAGEPWHEQFYSPLAAPGVGVSEGDYVIAVNGQSAGSVSNFYRLLENTGGDLVTLRINNRPAEAGARDVLVRTITSETSLRYLDWVEDRARRVTALSNGRIGYVHLPNTAVAGNRELMKRFLPQVGKEALIIDARYNGGGFIPDRMIEMVARKPLNFWKRRGLDPQSTPAIAHVGPKATLINGYSGSGGDAFPYYFRKLGLGPLIGTRTWGGLIGISGNPMLADGGGILASTFRFLDTDGAWAVENEGVKPDIEVVDRPELVAAGEDPSLERAVEYLLEQLEASPKRAFQSPPAPTDF